MTTTNFLWTATHQTADRGRATEAFDNPRDFRSFIRDNDRWLTSTSTPGRSEIESYARWIKRNTDANGVTPGGHNAHDLLADLRDEWRRAS